MKNKYYRCENCNTGCDYRISGLCRICNYEILSTKKQIITGKTVSQIRAEKGIVKKKKSILERLGAIK